MANTGAAIVGSEVSLRLDHPIHAGDGVIAAAIVRQKTHIDGQFGVRYCHGAKRPVALLIHARGETKAFQTSGAPLAFNECRALYPECCAAFEAFADQRAS